MNKHTYQSLTTKKRFEKAAVILDERFGIVIDDQPTGFSGIGDSNVEWDSTGEMIMNSEGHLVRANGFYVDCETNEATNIQNAFNKFGLGTCVVDEGETVMVFVD